MSFCGACATWRAGHLDQTILLVWPYIHIILWMNSCHTMQPILVKNNLPSTLFSSYNSMGGCWIQDRHNSTQSATPMPMPISLI